MTIIGKPQKFVMRDMMVEVPEDKRDSGLTTHPISQ